jgi:hypothetical protein
MEWYEFARATHRQKLDEARARQYSRLAISGSDSHRKNRWPTARHTLGEFISRAIVLLTALWHKLRQITVVGQPAKGSSNGFK